MEQEHIIQFQMMEQEVNQLNEQLQLIEKNISEMQELAESLEEIKKSESTEILANLGKRIYIPVEIKEKKLLVDVGKGSFIKKSIPETKTVIEDQIKRLIEGRDQVIKRLEDIQEEMKRLFESVEKDGDKEKKNSNK